jgi:hypothetical protein
LLLFARSSTNVVALHQEHAERIQRNAAGRDGLDATDLGLLLQNQNPVKRLTSGPERRTEQPITAGGKVRYEERVPWWTDYGGTFCLFGHYGLADGTPRGNRSAFCVDFGAGNRWRERHEGKRHGFAWKLAAFRYPERELVFDEGERRSV